MEEEAVLSEVNDSAASARSLSSCAGRWLTRLQSSLDALQDLSLLTFDVSASPK